MDASAIERLIPPEITGDGFTDVIRALARGEELHNVLEIGSSSGGGSTEAFVTGLRDNPHRPTLFCMEISKPRFQALADRYRPDSFVQCYNVSSVGTEAFPTPTDVLEFYHANDTGLNRYPATDVLQWLEQDIAYVRDSGVPADGIARVKADNGIDYFDLVLIDGSEFTGDAELRQVYGAKFILLDDINTYKNYANHARLAADERYTLIYHEPSLRNGCSAFRRVGPAAPAPVWERMKGDPTRGLATDLPIHFFTIVLNGMPFLKYHLDVFQRLPFRWHWHIVEGVATLTKDTAWSVAGGGRIPAHVHRAGRSNDGTSEYLDELKRSHPDNVTIYRKPVGEFWDGKVEMVNAPLGNISEECLLWQIDADELWTGEQFDSARRLFQDNPSRTAAYYWCWFFVGPELVVNSRYCYSQNPRSEWLRAWRFRPGMRWAAHEPPSLGYETSNGSFRDWAKVNPFAHDETEAAGLVFQHYAYATFRQLMFKEDYYGYKNAVSSWIELQGEKRFPAKLGDFFSWVNDNTTVERAAKLGIRPLASGAPTASEWRFAA